MEIVNIVDYAMPLIKIEKLARDVHNLCLEKHYRQANDLTTQMIAEMRILQASLGLMELDKNQTWPKPLGDY